MYGHGGGADVGAINIWAANYILISIISIISVLLRHY